MHPKVIAYSVANVAMIHTCGMKVLVASNGTWMTNIPAPPNTVEQDSKYGRTGVKSQPKYMQSPLRPCSCCESEDSLSISASSRSAGFAGPTFGEVALEASNVGARADWLWRAAAPMLGGISIRSNGYGRRISKVYSSRSQLPSTTSLSKSKEVKDGKRGSIQDQQTLCQLYISANYEGSLAPRKSRKRELCCFRLSRWMSLDQEMFLYDALCVESNPRLCRHQWKISGR